MSKKKRKAGESGQAAAAAAPGAAFASVQQSARGAGRPAAALKDPGDRPSGKLVTWLLALMLFLAPTLGVPHEEMLQDTLKSMVVAGMALCALLLFLWQERGARLALRWHALVMLPLALMVYALGSMAWSHTYLGGVEAIRWFVFSVIVFLGLQCFRRERFDALAWGIHLGAVGACLWTALQFWFDLKLFPQGPNPASTFVNRNFVAEFVVCTLPFSAWLLRGLKTRWQIALMAFSTGFNVVAILMTGTRSALIAMLAFVAVLVVVLYRYCASWPAWARADRLIAIGVLAATVGVLGLLPSNNASLEAELQTQGAHLRPILRSLLRVQSIGDPLEYRERAFSIRWVMWSATGRMIAANPVVGVGAGAWEVEIPRYQAKGSQLETDYYVHNEVLQLLAEYGLVGWLFLLMLLAYLSHAAWRTWRASDQTQGHQASSDALAEAPQRSLVLASLLLFLIVSNAGFPWRMASTGAMFAVCLGLLAASDARLASRVAAPVNAFTLRGRPMLGLLVWKPLAARVALGASIAAFALFAYISQQAAQAESAIVRGVKIALTISQSQDPNNRAWDDSKRQMIDLMREGVGITHHYRKLTPIVADELAKWGDWANAVWIWESVVRSRPYIVAVMTNVARGYSTLGNVDRAEEYLRRCAELQPNATSVRSLQVIILGRRGQQAEALTLTRQSLDEGIVDYDLTNAAYILGRLHGDWDLALRGLALRAKGWPGTAVDAMLKSGEIYADAKLAQHDQVKARDAYRQAYVQALDKDKAAVMAEIPEPYRADVRQAAR